MKTFILIMAVFLSLCIDIFAADTYTKKILIIPEGKNDKENLAITDALQLKNLLGHFNTSVTIKYADDYKRNDVEAYDYCFYLGFYIKNKLPDVLLQDLIKTKKQIIWMNTGIIDASQHHEFTDKFGFAVSDIDSGSVFDFVKYNKIIFTKGETNTHVIKIRNNSGVEVLATAYSSKTKKEIPYLVKINNLLYFADSPFSYADASDRYILFADMLHDILNENHESSHSGIVRIEDVTALHDPDKLREIAEMLSSKGIPFLIGVVPIYVDPSLGLRVTLSDKPAIVDALKFIERNGGTIVMHGVTHQYHGVSTNDFEFWDQQSNGPIKGETEEQIAKKIELGLQEFFKNGLHPLLWETPHYTASTLLYKTVTKYFSTAIEQRLVIDNFDYGQYFPYIINSDLYGQKILPENLGYVPLDPANPAVSKKAVQDIAKGARANLFVRDGFASFFFHPFLDLNLLDEITDSLQAMGYTFIDVRHMKNTVRTKDKILMSGSQSYTIQLDDQYLLESYYADNGQLKQKTISSKRLSGKITKDIELEPGEMYTAQPTEYREVELSFWQKAMNDVKKFFKKIISPKEQWVVPKVAIFWNYYARGEFYNDQASFVSAFHSVNIEVDTIFIGQRYDLTKYNMLIIPNASIDSLQQSDYDFFVSFVQNGGNLITDFTHNYLADEFGIKFTKKTFPVISVRDNYFPEEQINWQYSRNVSKLQVENDDIIFCQDAISDAPLVIGRKIKNGKVIFISTLFDSETQQGWSKYPYFIEYVRRFFGIKPFIKRDNLEVYFDPGFRSTYSIETLVKQWKSLNVRAVHAAGWHEYKKYTYDYERLIRLAHANGILVYAWLEPPQVSKLFWDNHPEWREKNYKGEDARPSWRFPVALTDPSCLNAMKNEYMKLLNNFDWDGVNLAELYFEAGKGFTQPELFTPMHSSAVKEFKSRYNFNLADIFDRHSEFYWQHNHNARKSVEIYRINKLTEVYKILLDQFENLKNKRHGFDVIVTAMDSYGSPELKENIAVDMDEIIKLQKQYDFGLNVEDPENLWSTDPMRYISIGKLYDSMLTNHNKLLLDLNILNFRKKENLTPFPTLIQTGTEAYILVNSAAKAARRVIIYSESSVNPQDMIFFGNAMSSDVQYRTTKDGFHFSSDNSFYLELHDKINAINLNGQIVSTSMENGFLIPAGENKVTYMNEQGNFFSTAEIEPKIISLTGNLLAVSYNMRDIFFNYSSETRTIVSVNMSPVSVSVDGKPYDFTVMKGNECYSVFLPPGNHSVKMKLSDAFSFGVNFTSLLSSSAIALFGVLAVLLLLGMYLALKIIKTKNSAITKRI